MGNISEIWTIEKVKTQETGKKPQYSLHGCIKKKAMKS